jgi:uncharacterized protein YjbI with pentapeptide repeats
LGGAQLQGANLGGVQLQKVNLIGRGTRQVEGRSIARLAEAHIDEDTKLPAGMREALQAYLEQLK